MKIKRIFNFICFFVVVPIAAFFSFDTLIRSFQIHQTIEKADILVWAGEAGSHCLPNTMRDTFEAFGPESVKKSVVLLDATSPVTGFEKNQDDFFKEFESKGVKFVKTTDFLV